MGFISVAVSVIKDDFVYEVFITSISSLYLLFFKIKIQIQI